MVLPKKESGVNKKNQIEIQQQNKTTSRLKGYGVVLLLWVLIKAK